MNKNRERVENKEENTENEIEVVEEPENENETENLQTWTKNKMRGFKRASPASNPVPKEKSSDQNLGTKHKPKAGTAAPPVGGQPSPPSSATTRSTSAGTGTGTTEQAGFGSGSNSSSSEPDPYEGRYCHYFVNKGKCNYQEMSGQKCRFEHKVAPMCSYGSSCTRTKCMYSHPKIGGNDNFLGNTRGFPTMMNPWNVMNPWMSAVNPWNMQRNRNSQ